MQTVNGVSIAGTERLLLQTGSGNDNINNSTTNTNDEILTGAGNDTVEAGPGNDVINGGPGFDTASYASASGAVLASLLTGTASGAAGNDSLANIEALSGSRFDDRLTGNALDNTLAGNVGNDQLQGLGGNDTLRGGLGTDTLDGGDGNDQLYGDQGNDSLTGGNGNDLLDGGTGIDAMDGGAGDDNYGVDNAGDTITELAGGGIDSVVASVSYTPAVNVESLTLNGTAAIRGTGNAGNNTLVGNALRNTLIGGAGDDVLNGGSGADRLEGGIGNDTFYVDNAGDVVVENSGEGTDTVYASINHTLADNVDNLVLSGTAALQGVGNALANNITGNALAYTLSGGAGNDTLLGLGGADTLDGGPGVDRMEGGAGNDTYVVDDAGDLVVELAGQGTLDTLQANISYTLADQVERLVLAGSANLAGTGNALANTLTGNCGANRLDGGAGADILTGGAAADMFVFSTALGAGNVDSVADFERGIDQIHLAALVFAGLGPAYQALGASLFASGAGLVAAADAATRIVFDTRTGNLYYDADGVGGRGGSVVCHPAWPRPGGPFSRFAFLCCRDYTAALLGRCGVKRHFMPSSPCAQARWLVASLALLSGVSPRSMNEQLEVLEAEVLKLAPAERTRLLERLIASLDTDPEIEAAWDQEADRREAALASGAVCAVPGHEAIARLQARLSR